MKEFIVAMILMIKIAFAYACVLIGLLLGIPGHLLQTIGRAFVTLGEKMMRGKRLNNGPEIVNQIVDM